ncbi:MAG: hypothetical protein K9M51_00860 [Candidatus Gracilibacteria bacterium]|nr:hypothetical protein [Candidatus Gracilibacteria bacterium]
MTASDTSAQAQVDFDALMKRLLGLLTKKEQDVIERRFAIGKDKRETLDKIGKSYSITRERVRQIEAVAIQKLARISQDKSIRVVHDLAISVLNEHGKVMSEALLVSEMIKHIGKNKNVGVNAVKFTLWVSDRLEKHEKNQFYRPFWYTADVKLSEIKAGIRDIKKVLEKKHDVMSFSEIAQTLGTKYPEAMLESLLYISWDFLKTEKGWGLKSWRFINPRSIKDCITIILKKHGKPLHFSEIMERILRDFPNRKRVTPQASHNELIRHDEFVLVGRGLYGLKEWGYAAGTVCDLIRSVLLENKGPMKRQQIIKKVLEKRDVRLGTISLSLQKYPFFKRVGRAVYEYDGSLDKNRRRKYSG